MLLGGLGCIFMHFYEIYLRMHLARAWQLTACSSVPRDACPQGSSSGRDVVPWGTATPGGGILKFCSSRPPCIVCVRHFVSRFIVVT